MLRSALTQIRQVGKIFLGPIRRDCPYVESVALEAVAACARPAAQRLDLKIGLRPRSELNGCCLAEIDPVARHRESVGSRHKIVQEHSTRQAFTHRHAVRGDIWRGQAFPRLELAQDPTPRQPRLDRRGSRYRRRQCRPGHIAGQRLEADADQQGSHRLDFRCHFSYLGGVGKGAAKYSRCCRCCRRRWESPPSNDLVARWRHHRPQLETPYSNKPMIFYGWQAGGLDYVFRTETLKAEKPRQYPVAFALAAGTVGSWLCRCPAINSSRWYRRRSGSRFRIRSSPERNH